MIADVDNQHIARRIRRLKFWQACRFLLPVVLVLSVVSFYVAGNLYFSTERAIQTNWGISVPDGLQELEHHEEQSFHGDGYRFTVFDVEDSTHLGGTFFDAPRMSAAPLTTEQLELVSTVANEFRPETQLAVAQAGLMKSERARGSNRLLCLFDSTTGRFFIYEEFL